MEARNETILAMFPPINAEFVDATWIDTNGYVEMGADGLLFTSTIDLSGWTMHDFTFGIVKALAQDPGVYSSTAASARMEVMEIISDVPINLAALTVIKDAMGVTSPGMLNSAQDFTTILYGTYKLYVPNASLAAFPGFMQQLGGGSFGSKEPTASSELYCYRLIKCLGAPGELLAAPASRIGLFGAMFQEGDLEYMMRLKRSYELQQLV
jgi:hypothetical protein